MSVLRPGPPPPIGVWFSTPASTRLPPHEHRVWEVNLLVSGQVTYRIAGDSWSVARGGLLVMGPGVEHELIGMHAETALWVIEIESSLIAGAPWTRHDTGAYALEPVARTELVRVLQKLWLRPTESTRAAFEQRLVLALTRDFAPIEGSRASTAELEAPLSDRVHEAVARAKRALESGAASDFDAAAIARAAGISPSRLAHLFQDQVSLTPLQYRNFCAVQQFIRSYRGDRANLLGANPPGVGAPSESLLRAALTAGFGSYPQFHRTFQQVCGASPKSHFEWLGAEVLRPEPKR